MLVAHLYIVVGALIEFDSLPIVDGRAIGGMKIRKVTNTFIGFYYFSIEIRANANENGIRRMHVCQT